MLPRRTVVVERGATPRTNGAVRSDLRNMVIVTIKSNRSSSKFEMLRRATDSSQSGK